MKKILYWTAAVILLGVLGVSAVQLWTIHRNYTTEENAHRELMAYRPSLQEHSEASQPPAPETAPEPERDAGPQWNAEILALRQAHPDAVGWLTVPGTAVDYAFVQSGDNAYYLHRDIDGNYLYAGIPYLDFRCAQDFSSGNSIIYGHHMKNGTMFASLTSFKDRDFFEENREFSIYLEDRTLTVEIIACLIVDPTEANYLFQTMPEADFISRLKEDARVYLDTEQRVDDRFVTLATCDYEFDNCRAVLVGRIVSPGE